MGEPKKQCEESLRRKEQLTTYLLGDFLKHRNFPPELVVAASGKDPSNLASALPINSYAQDDTERVQTWCVEL